MKSLLLCVLFFGGHMARGESVSTATNSTLQWCPPPHKLLGNNMATRSKVSYISEIHGNFSCGRTGRTYSDGEDVARSLYWHIGILGFDKLHLQVFYDVATYPTPPTVEDIYPSHKHCVSSWEKIGALVWEPLPYPGRRDQWPIGGAAGPPEDKGKPTLHFNLHKTERGLNPAYKRWKDSNDWLMIVDIDEYVIPVNYELKSNECPWRNNIKNVDNAAAMPSIIETLLQSVMIAATNMHLFDYHKMVDESRVENSNNNAANASSVCDFGHSDSNEKRGQMETFCKEINYITMPVYPLAGNNRDFTKKDFPNLRSQTHICYPKPDRLKKTEETASSAQWWKSITRTATTPELHGALTMHLSTGFGILAPRTYHKGVVSLEIGHVKTVTSEKLSWFVQDNRLIDLQTHFNACQQQQQQQ